MLKLTGYLNYKRITVDDSAPTSMKNAAKREM